MNNITSYRRPYQRELNERQAAFVKAYVATGDAHQSALAAGYPEATARNANAHMFESDNVLLAIAEASKGRLIRGAPVALNVVEQLMTGAVSERVRLEASKTWLDRAGLIAPKPEDGRSEVEPALNEMSIDEIHRYIARLEADRGDKAKPISVARVKDTTDLDDVLG